MSAQIRLIAAGVVCLAVVLAVYGIVWGEGGHQALTTDIVTQILTNRNEFPDIVATVNGDPLTGAALARQVQIANLNAGSSLTPDSAVGAALNGLIRNELLVQEAKNRGLWPSPDDVLSKTRRYIEWLKSLPEGSGERKISEQVFQLQGIDTNSLDANPDFLLYEAREIAVTRLNGAVRASLPAPQQRDPQVVRAAMDRLVDDLIEQATIQLFVYASPAPPFRAGESTNRDGSSGGGIDINSLSTPSTSQPR
ncbi:MAG: SurA N-terminal domain-containing protein [Dehalococcoidia bacterium]|nr:SurA N-terminal domain-containing protein [Dehalococcoidia bacterium]